VYLARRWRGSGRAVSQLSIPGNCGDDSGGHFTDSAVADVRDIDVSGSVHRAGEVEAAPGKAECAAASAK